MRHIRAGVVAAAVGLGLGALPAAPALALAPGTTVGPAGHEYAAALLSGTTADFVVGNTTVKCNQSGTVGQVPAEPANTSPDGPVTSPLTPATFGNNGANCPTNVPFTTARTVSNSTNGPWTIALRWDPAGATGTMSIPAAGVVTTITGLASCTVTVAPDGPATVSGPWRPGDEAGPPVLDFSGGVTLPIQVTGGFACPTGATTATFRAQYTIADTTDPTQRITVSDGTPPPPPEG
ncbi:hypothetical protein AB0M36_22790 [Actinoplanes sp. NPDC051346]|uniref:hypothetical protein n=1 Tax=Actinoplanes sp. NPDC051346 TaxID=3155048 RepID=UPI00343712AC